MDLEKLFYQGRFEEIINISDTSPPIEEVRLFQARLCLEACEFEQVVELLNKSSWERLMDIQLKKKYKGKASYPDCLDGLKQLSVVEIKVKNEELHMLTQVKKNAKKMFTCLNLKVPEKVIYESNPNVQYVGPA